MSLAHPALTTIGKRKGKQKWASAEQKHKAEQLERDWKALQEKWNIDTLTKKRKNALKAKVYVPPTKNPRLQELDRIPSLDTGYKGAVTIKKPMQYTGDKLIGIGTLHKSNAVPIFTDQEAKDISSMRR